MADKKTLALLLYKHLQGTLTVEEKQLLEEWKQSSVNNEYLMQEVESTEALSEVLSEYHPDNKWALRNRVLQNISRDDVSPTEIKHVHRVHFLRKWGWVAASIIILLSAGIYGWLQMRVKPPQQVTETKPVNDALPGKNGAILTLSDGRKIVLDSLNNGIVAMQGNTNVKLQDGRLLYDKHTGKSLPAETAITYNTMTTPKGRQYQVMLPDGTKVWLNAASSLTYPTSFTGHDRKVEITGEAYFEVSKNKKFPFRVKINNAVEVEVLGTHFNVNAYSDEDNINTTLLEGAVKVTANNKTQLLAIGQQARVRQTDKTIKLVEDADVAQAVAWKNGFFSFNDADVPTVMRQLARWYDVEVAYEGAIPKGEFAGKIDRTLSLSQVLKGLAKARINYRIENGNKIIILP